jgi:hypothetical protein
MSRKSAPKSRQAIHDAIPLEASFYLVEGNKAVGQNKVDGALFMLLEVSPVRLGLLHREERLQLLQAYHDFLQGLRGSIGWYARDAAPDLAAYLQLIKRRAREARSPALHAAAMELYGHLRAQLAGQKMREKRFYLVLSQSAASPARTGGFWRLPLSRPARQEATKRRQQRLLGRVQALHRRAEDLVVRLSGLGLPARILGPEELLNLLREAYDPTRPALRWSQARRAIVTSAEENPCP